jgi:hypothetical protein
MAQKLTTPFQAKVDPLDIWRTPLHTGLTRCHHVYIRVLFGHLFVLVYRMKRTCARSQRELIRSLYSYWGCEVGTRCWNMLLNKHVDLLIATLLKLTSK